jgi:Glycosyl transferase family 8
MRIRPLLLILGWCSLLSICAVIRAVLRHDLGNAPNFEYHENSETPTASVSVERHVLYALSGNHSSFMREFEVSLKSLLLNAPPSNPLTIHIMADQQASTALKSTFENLGNSTTFPLCPTIINIQVHNVQRFVNRWRTTIESNTVLAATMTKRLRLYGHTIGTWFRLFANDVFEGNVDNVVYLDQDAIIMANIEDIWNHQLAGQSSSSTTRNQSLFYWGASQCAGFMVLRPSLQDRLWELYKQAPRSTVKSAMEKSNIVSDQHVFQVIQAVAPEFVGILGPEWDVSVVNPLWMKGLPSRMDAHRPNGVGMLHFNGGGTSPMSFFEAGNPVHYEKDKHWNLAKYFVDLPWSWAFFQMTSRQESGRKAYPLQIDFTGHPML